VPLASFRGWSVLRLLRYSALSGIIRLLYSRSVGVSSGSSDRRSRAQITFGKIRVKEMFEVAIFYCQHQTDRMMQALGTLNRSATPKIRKVALPCSGKLEVSFLLKALESGADAVAIFGCPEGKCQYLEGSTRAKNRVRYARRILGEIGLEEERIRRFVLAEPTTAGEMGSLTEWVSRVESMGGLDKNVKIRMQK
jgi:F420-non-reducing hydrogenase iron-sulfur subunit